MMLDILARVEVWDRFMSSSVMVALKLWDSKHVAKGFLIRNEHFRASRKIDIQFGVLSLQQHQLSGGAILLNSNI